MFDTQREELIWAGRKLVLETGKMARQADGAVVASYGETTVLATVVSAKEPKAGVDFFPLTVNYQERTYAAGRIPGGFFKRERGATEKETLTSRLIDRPIRPLFADGFRNETQVICTVLSHDMENDPDIVAMVATSAALTLSGVPFLGPIGAARVGYIGGQYTLNPPLQEMEGTTLDLVVAGSGSRLGGRRPGAVALENPAACDRVERGIEDAVQLRCEPGVLHLHHHLDATVEVPVHHVGAADPVLVAAPEMEQP